MHASLVIVIALGVAVLPPNAFAGPDRPALLQEIGLASKARGKAVRTFSVEVQYQIRKESKATGKLIDYAKAERIEMERPTGRFVIHRLGQSPQPPSTMLRKREDWLEEQEEIIIFDGEKTKSAIKGSGINPNTQAETKNALKFGRVYKGRRPAWVIDPEVYIGIYFGKTLDEELAEHSYRLLQSDRSTVLIESEPDPSRGDAAKKIHRRARFWIDPSKGMAVAGMEIALRFGAFGGWIPYYTSKTEEWQEVDGTWVPRRHHEVLYDVSYEGEKRLESDTIATLREWSINRPIPPEHFRFPFESGTIVNDTDKAIIYQAGALNDARLASDARTAIELRSRFHAAKEGLSNRPRPDAIHSTRGVLVAASTVVVCLILATRTIVRWRNLRRRKSPGTIS